jgi:hypothetical protein
MASLLCMSAGDDEGALMLVLNSMPTMTRFEVLETTVDGQMQPRPEGLQSPGGKVRKGTSSAQERHCLGRLHEIGACVSLSQPSTGSD